MLLSFLSDSVELTSIRKKILNYIVTCLDLFLLSDLNIGKPELNTLQTE